MPSVRSSRFKFAAQAVAQSGVERGERLVEQQHARPRRDRAGKRHALALAARELIDAAMFEPFDAGQRHQLGDARLALAVGDAADLQAVADIVGHIHVGKQRIGLKHHADIAPSRSARG